MPRVPQPAVVKISQAFDILGGETIDEAAQKLEESEARHFKEGYRVVSVSHAVDVSGDGPKWCGGDVRPADLPARNDHGAPPRRGLMTPSAATTAGRKPCA